MLRTRQHVSPTAQALLCTTVRKISAGYFLPSSSRSGRFPSDEGDPQVHIDERFSEHLAAAFPSTPHLDLAAHEFESLDDGLESDLDIAGGNSIAANSDDNEVEPFDIAGGNSIATNSDDNEGDQVKGTDNTLSPLRKATACGDELGLLTGSQLNLAALPATVPEASSSGSSSSDSSSESEAESVAFEEMATACDLESEAVKTGLWKVKGGKFHLSSEKSDLCFRCGVKISHAATRIIHKPMFLSPRCLRCFGN